MKLWAAKCSRGKQIMGGWFGCRGNEKHHFVYGYSGQSKRRKHRKTVGKHSLAIYLTNIVNA